MSTSKSFPIYRKYEHERTFFKITSTATFTQLDIIGDGYMVYEFRVNVHPDRMLILDMIEMEGDAWLESSEQEYEGKMDYCVKNLKLIG